MIAALLLFWAGSALAHGNHHHAQAETPATPDAALALKVAYGKIGEAYVQRVRPIFLEKCFDCHSNKTVYPNYYKIPGIKQYIDSDIAEGREHLDFSNDYPFVSHATPLEDLDAIKKAIEEGTMPPLLYRLMHRETAIAPDEKRLIFDWVDWSRSQLQAATSLTKKN